MLDACFGASEFESMSTEKLPLLKSPPDLGGHGMLIAGSGELQPVAGKHGVYRLAVSEADRMPELGRALDELGRGTVWNALTSWFRQAQQVGLFGQIPIERAAGSFMALLGADLPLRLMLGAVPPPTADEIAQRASAAIAGFARLWLRP